MARFARVSPGGGGGGGGGFGPRRVWQNRTTGTDTGTDTTTGTGTDTDTGTGTDTGTTAADPGSAATAPTAAGSAGMGFEGPAGRTADTDTDTGTDAGAGGGPTPTRQTAPTDPTFDRVRTGEATTADAADPVQPTQAARLRRTLLETDTTPEVTDDDTAQAAETRRLRSKLAPTATATGRQATRRTQTDAGSAGFGRELQDVSHAFWDTTIDVAFQEQAAERLAEQIGLPEDRQSDDIAISGPSITLEEGEQGDLDTDVTDKLTEGKGLISDEQERDLARTAQQRQDYFGVGSEAEALARDLTGSDTAAEFAGGVGSVPGQIAAAPAQTALIADLATETASNLPETVQEEGAGDTALAFAETAGRVTKTLTESAQENPARFTGQLAGEALLGTAAFKGLEKAGDVRRSAKLSTPETVDFSDITTDAGTEGELPNFDTSPDAATADAVEEVSERATDNPDVVTDQTGGDATVYHGTDTDFGAAVDVQEGASELPGLFTSPEASPIRLEDVATSLPSPSLKPRVPDLSGRSDRFLGLPGDRVEGFPEGRAGAGYELRDVDTGEQVHGGLGRGEAKSIADDVADVEVRPDQTTTGFEFLTDEADPGTAYVRPSGQRKPELEAVFAPESQFEKTGQIGVRVGRRQFPGTDVDVPFSGRQVPLDTFERAGDTTDVADDTDLEAAGTGDVVDYGDVVSETQRLSERGSVAAGGALAGPLAGSLPSTDATTGGDGATPSPASDSAGTEIGAGTSDASPAGSGDPSATGSGAGVSADSSDATSDMTRSDTGPATGSPTGFPGSNGGGSGGGGGSPGGSGPPTPSNLGSYPSFSAPSTSEEPTPSDIPLLDSEPDEDESVLRSDEFQAGLFDTGIADLDELENREF